MCKVYFKIYFINLIYKTTPTNALTETDEENYVCNSYCTCFFKRLDCTVLIKILQSDRKSNGVSHFKYQLPYTEIFEHTLTEGRIPV